MPPRIQHVFNNSTLSHHQNSNNSNINGRRISLHIKRESTVESEGLSNTIPPYSHSPPTQIHPNRESDAESDDSDQEVNDDSNFDSDGSEPDENKLQHRPSPLGSGNVENIRDNLNFRGYAPSGLAEPAIDLRNFNFGGREASPVHQDPEWAIHNLDGIGWEQGFGIEVPPPYPRHLYRHDYVDDNNRVQRPEHQQYRSGTGPTPKFGNGWPHY